MKAYLETSQYIDWEHPEILKLAKRLAGDSDFETIRNCFEFVRDEVRHSMDYQCNPVTLAASEVLAHKTGFCYAKSHLLAALLRANGIPCALSYQRLTLSDDGSGERYSLHGLNSVYMEEYGWFRLDARGNKEGVNAQFTPPVETLAFPIRFEGEKDIPGIYSEPLEPVVQVLENSKTYQEVAENLPDIKEGISSG